MMRITQESADALMARLPAVRGALRPLVPLGPGSWFGVGGPAEVFFKPADAEDLRHMLANRPPDVPITLIGATSNLLVRDGGIPGIVIKFGPAFARIHAEDDLVVAGAGAHVAMISRRAAEMGIGGFEFLSGIPGTLGGALRMNAGAHDQATADLLQSADIHDDFGHPSTLSRDALRFGYRTCGLPENCIFVSAVLKGRKEDRKIIEARLAEMKAHRDAFQPERVRTAGSTFANPETAPKAWELIDKAGCRGMMVGGAKMHEKHANFMVNTGKATAKDLEDLGEKVRRLVKETSGVDLIWEVRRVGIPLFEGEDPS